jgi:seryl-tRNA synthetase
MIDLKKLSQDPTIFTQELARRNKDTSLATELAKSYNEQLVIQKELDAQRQIKNEFNAQVVKLSGEEKQIAISKMKEVSDTIKDLESKINEVKTKVDTLAYKIPNITSQVTPVGETDEDNVVINNFGEIPKFDFEPKHYHELPVFKKNYFGEKGVEAFGTRGYYIKGDLAKLQKALFGFVLDNLESKGFEYVIPPIMVNNKTMYGTGFFPDGIEDTYSVTASDKTFYLVGTSEAPLMFLHSNSTIDLTKPVLLTANTPCFRKEAGSYGKDTMGGIRVHQFDKIETVALCKPEEADAVFDMLTDTFTQNAMSLGLAIQHLDVCTGDISMKNHRQIDIEAWFPAQMKFRELCSSSNCTDYQTRNLNITYIDVNGNKSLAYSLNATGVTNRMMFAILEQNQQADGSVKLPKILADLLGKTILN